MRNSLLENYYDDACDIGILETYQKYKDVINGILKNDTTKLKKLESERDLNPEYYYVLTSIDIDSEYNDYGNCYTNQNGELYCLTEEGLMHCSENECQYGYPLSQVYYDMEKFIKYNDFLKKENSEEIQI